MIHPCTIMAVPSVHTFPSLIWHATHVVKEYTLKPEYGPDTLLTNNSQDVL